LSRIAVHWFGFRFAMLTTSGLRIGQTPARRREPGRGHRSLIAHNECGRINPTATIQCLNSWELFPSILRSHFVLSALSAKQDLGAGLTPPTNLWRWESNYRTCWTCWTYWTCWTFGFLFFVFFKVRRLICRLARSLP